MFDKESLKEVRELFEIYRQQREKELNNLRLLLRKINGGVDVFHYWSSDSNILISKASHSEAMHILLDMEGRNKAEENESLQDSFREKATGMNKYSKDHPYGEGHN